MGMRRRMQRQLKKRRGQKKMATKMKMIKIPPALTIKVPAHITHNGLGGTYELPFADFIAERPLNDQRFSVPRSKTNQANRLEAEVRAVKEGDVWFIEAREDYPAVKLGLEEPQGPAAQVPTWMSKQLDTFRDAVLDAEDALAEQAQPLRAVGDDNGPA